MQGMVALVVKCAQLSDPHSLAARQGSTSDIAAARANRKASYQYLLAELQPLIAGSQLLAAPVGQAAAAAGANGGAGQLKNGTPMSPAEMRAAKEAIIQVSRVFRGLTTIVTVFGLSHLCMGPTKINSSNMLWFALLLCVTAR